MSILVIGEQEEKNIKIAIEAARAKPLPWSVIKDIIDDTDTNTLLLKDRKSEQLEEIRREYPTQNVMLGTYRAAFSFEEQPAGMMRHLSVSSHHPDRLPGPEVMKVIASEFGFTGLRASRIWIEEYEPGRRAVNIVELDDEQIP